MTGEQRWTIYVCPECGQWSGSYFQRCELTQLHDSKKYAHPVEVEVAPAALLEQAREALFECAKRSGADISDGAPTWPPLYEWAVQEVTRLRSDYDECPLPEDLQQAREALEVVLRAAAPKSGRSAHSRLNQIVSVANLALASGAVPGREGGQQHG